MFKYSQFDLITKTNKKTKFIIKLLINIIIIIFILIIFLINIDTKDDVKFISSNSRRIINNLHNYTETISDFIVSNNNNNDNNDNNNNNQIEELNELKNIRLSIDYFKELKEQEIKEREIKEREIKEREIKEREIKEREIKKEKAINLIKSYINFNLSFHLVPSYSKLNGYSENNQCLLELININNDELFNKLIKIDYENNEVSFNYLDENKEYYKNTDNIIETHIYNNYDENNRFYKYSHYIYRNFKENIIKNPLYQIIKEKLEIDYSYTEPNPTEEYNNKSKYFSESLNEFYQIYNNDYYRWNKYYENYYNDTYYLYLKNENYNLISDYFVEFLIKNELFINNPNPYEYYNKLYNFYKYICYIPSMYIINENKPPIIRNNYDLTSSSYMNVDNRGHTHMDYLNNIENTLNIDIDSYIGKIAIGSFDTNNFYINHDGFHYFYNIKPDIYELEKNKGSRMIKHNLTNNLQIVSLSGYDGSVRISNHYFIEKVSIDFSLISNIIYDEYEYIKVILSNIANIYDLPIIPPIKFI
jgi:hypothetical protein